MTFGSVLGWGTDSIRFRWAEFSWYLGLPLEMNNRNKRKEKLQAEQLRILAIRLGLSFVTENYKKCHQKIPGQERIYYNLFSYSHLQDWVYVIGKEPQRTLIPEPIAFC